MEACSELVKLKNCLEAHVLELTDGKGRKCQS